MKKFNKSGHLLGNANLPKHASPFIQGTEAVDADGYIPSLRAIAGTWFRELNVTTDVGSITLIITNVNSTASGIAGHLQTIVTFINSHSSNVSPIVAKASIYSGGLLLETTTSSVGSFIRIDKATNYDNSAKNFGFPIHPHSQATVSFGELKTAAVNSLTQKNPTGTAFVATGEDRSSSNFNRGLYSIASGADSQQAMLEKPIARLVSFKLPITAGSNPRFIVDTASNAVKAINMSSSISDALSAQLQSRVLIGNLSKTSSMRDIRRYFQVTDPDNKEVIFGQAALPVRVSGVVTGPATGSNPPGPFTLDSTPASSMGDASAIGDSLNVLSIDISRFPGSSPISITKVHDAYTIECSAATFIDSLGNPNVFAGDKLVLTGSTYNNGTYIIENVISATMVEVKPAVFTDVTELNTGDHTGAIAVSTGGAFVKDVTLYLTERLQLPLTHDIYVTMPMENSIGDLDEDALISQRNVEVPHWVVENLYLNKTLEGAYIGTGESSEKAAGFHINTYSKPITIQPTKAIGNAPGSVDRTINSITIGSNNIISILASSSDTFSSSDVGMFVRFNIPEPTGTITDSVLLNKDMAVVVTVLDSKRAKVKRVSRSSIALPTMSVTSIDIVTEEATPFIPGLISAEHYLDTSAGGYSTILENTQNADKKDPDAILTSAELVRIHKLGDTVTTPVFKIATSGEEVTAAVGVDGVYLNLSYPNNDSDIVGTNLLVRIYNGVNAGWYLVKNISDANPAVFSVSTLGIDSVSFAASSALQYAAVYRVSQGVRSVGGVTSSSKSIAQHSVSAVANQGDTTVGYQATWKGVGAGVYVHSNYHTMSADDVYAGYGASGINIYSISGPGSDGIQSVSIGLEGFDNSNMSATAEISIANVKGLGTPAILGSGQTYHLDPANTTLGSSFKYSGGGGLFLSMTNDPALVINMENKSINHEQAASAAGVFIDRRSTRDYGQSASALAIYGNMFAPTLNSSAPGKDPYNFYTEHSLSAANVFSSEPEEIDITDTDVYQSLIGSSTILGRSCPDSEKFVTRATKYNYSIFNVEHDLILRVQTFASEDFPSPSYPSFFSPASYQDAIGAFVFFIEETTGAAANVFTLINSSIDNTVHDLPFKLHNRESTKGCKIGFKIVACQVDQSDPTMAYYALSAGKRSTLSSEIALSSLGTIEASAIIVRPRFLANIDLGDYTRIGTSVSLSTYGFEDTSLDSHKFPVLSVEDINQNTETTTLVFNSNGVRKGTVSSNKITQAGYPAADSSLVKTPDVNVSTVLPDPFRYLPSTDKNYQAPDFSFMLSDDVVPGFPVDSLAKNGQSFSYGGHSIFITSDGSTATLKSNCTVASSSKFTTKFKGGGKKLVLSASGQTVNYLISVKVGTNHFNGINGITLEVTLANSHPGNKTLLVSLNREIPSTNSGNIGILTKTIDLYDSTVPDILFRSYQKIKVTFTRDELASVIDPSELADEDNGFFITIGNLSAVVGYHLHTSIEQQSGVLKRQIGLGTGTITELTRYEQLYNSFGQIIGQTPIYETTDERSLFPDVWYIYDIAVKYDKKQASLSSGLNVDGVVQTRSLRMLAPVTGYQVVGPASADLLQNSEYGNSQGHDRLYSSTSLTGSTYYFSVPANNGDAATNLEGRDVGLLPLWYNFYPTAKENNLIPLQVPGEGTSLKQSIDDWSTSPGSFLKIPASGDIVFVDGFLGDEGSLSVDKYRLGLRVEDEDGGFVSTLQGVDDFSNTHHFFEWFTFPVAVNGSPFNAQGLVISNSRITFALPLTITKYYRPKFDRTAFFRKGAHSAAIHGHHPFFDPMFYWLHCASPVHFDRDGIRYETQDIKYNDEGEPFDGYNTSDSFGISADAIFSNELDMGSYRQGKGVSSGSDYVKIRDSKVNPDSFIPPGRTGFIVPIDPPHGSKLTEVKLNVSLRPSVTRVFTGRKSIGDLDVNYHVWHSIPELPSSQNNIQDLTGDYWLGKDGWDEKEGYRVRVWKHSPFDEGSLFGESPDGVDTPSITGTSVNMEGHGVLLHEEIVSVRQVAANGSTGSPDQYLDTGTCKIAEAISRVQIKFADSDNFIVDRSSYCYFVTIEFYTGVRKKISLNNAANQSKDCYFIPGYSYDSMDKFNADHAPYMWTAAFPGRRPTAMSSVWGNDQALKWEGYWSPYPHTATIEHGQMPQTVYRGSLLNINPPLGITRDSVSYSLHDTEIATTTDLSKVQLKQDTFPILQWDDSVQNPDIHLVDTSNEANVINDILNTREIFDHTVWYPVIKFRGLRIAYEMDRPGHGGWGG